MQTLGAPVQPVHEMAGLNPEGTPGRSGFAEYARLRGAAIVAPQLGHEDELPSRATLFKQLGDDWRQLSASDREGYARKAVTQQQKQRVDEVKQELAVLQGGEGGSAPVIPLFKRATRHKTASSHDDYWLELQPTADGKLDVRWRIQCPATTLIVALGWARGRAAYVERVDSSVSAGASEGVITFSNAQCARFIGQRLSQQSQQAEGQQQEEEQDEAPSSSLRCAKPAVVRLWLDQSLGEHVAGTEPFLLSSVNDQRGGGGDSRGDPGRGDEEKGTPRAPVLFTIEKPHDCDWDHQ